MRNTDPQSRVTTKGVHSSEWEESQGSPEVTVCIVNWNSGDYLRRCVSALYQATKTPLRVLIVDNDSSDDSLELLEASNLPSTIVQTGTNLGYAGGVNVALEHVQTPYALLLNPDAFVHTGCVDALLRCARSHPRAAAVGAGLRYPDGSLQPAARNFPSPVTHFIEVFRLYRLLWHVPGIGRWYMLVSPQDRTQQVDWVVGACWLVRISAARDVGPLDDTFFMYAEELDWCLRARRRGWQIWFESRAVATHVLGGSSSKNELPMMVQSYKSVYLFFRKYYPRSTNMAVRLITRMAMLVRALALPLRGKWRDKARLRAYWEVIRL